MTILETDPAQQITGDAQWEKPVRFSMVAVRPKGVVARKRHLRCSESLNASGCVDSGETLSDDLQLQAAAKGRHAF